MTVPSEKILRFLESHTLITPSALETKLGIPHGTIRHNRNVPYKYVRKIEAELSKYGYALDAPSYNAGLANGNVQVLQRNGSEFVNVSPPGSKIIII